MLNCLEKSLLDISWLLETSIALKDACTTFSSVVWCPLHELLRVIYVISKRAASADNASSCVIDLISLLAEVFTCGVQYSRLPFIMPL